MNLPGIFVFIMALLTLFVYTEAAPKVNLKSIVKGGKIIVSR